MTRHPVLPISASLEKSDDFLPSPPSDPIHPLPFPPPPTHSAVCLALLPGRCPTGQGVPTYRPGDSIHGMLTISVRSGGWSHSEIIVSVRGRAYATQVGDGFSCLTLMDAAVPAAPAGRLGAGVHAVPFSFLLAGVRGAPLFESYAGAHVTIDYRCAVAIGRGFFARELEDGAGFSVEVPSPPPGGVAAARAVAFDLRPSPAIENYTARSSRDIPNFHVTGQFLSHGSGGDPNTVVADASGSLEGAVTIVSSDVPVKTVELTLLREEGVDPSLLSAPVRRHGRLGGYLAKVSGEVCTWQVVDGDVPRGTQVPVYVVLPRLCSTLREEKLRVEFEIKVSVYFVDGFVVSETFPLYLYRGV